MKPIVPAVALPVWSNLHAAAKKFNTARPWEEFDDTDLIGVFDPSTGQNGFGCVMGSAGMLFGFCLYRGAEGFEVYRKMMEESEEFDLDAFALQNAVKLEYGSRSDLEEEDRAVARALGLSFKGPRAWPEFRSLVPGYAPWFVTESEAKFLTLGLQAVCTHLERVRRREADESLRDGECLVYRYGPDGGTGEGMTSQWEPWPVPPVQSIVPPVLNLASINALRAKRLEPDSPWEAGVFYFPTPVLDRERPYYLRLAAVCQQSSGFSFFAEPLPPDKSREQALGDAICRAVEKHSFLPDTIFVGTTTEAAALTPLGKALGISFRKGENLEAIQELKTAMMESFLKTGGR